MRIALVAGNDGADAQEQADLAAALREAGEQVTEHVMIAGPDAGVRDVAPDFTAELRSLWSGEGPDVVHAFGWAGGMAALAAARDTGVPVVTSFGSLAVTERRHGPGPVHSERARLERAIGASSRAVIAASSEEAGDLVRMGVCRGRVHTVPIGVDTAVFTPDGPVSPEAHGAEDAKPRVIAAAGVDDDQAVTLARAVALVPGAELITCPAGARGAELATVLRSADVFVYIPAHAPRGTRCLQAMACGVPVIASCVGAHVDMIVDGTTGLLVAPGRPELLGAQIRHLLGHPLQRQAYGMAAADRARSRYSRERVAGEILAVLEEAAETDSLAA